MPFTGAKSDVLESSLLDHVFGGASFAQPTGLYLSLHTGLTAAPTEAGGSGDEVTGVAYARLDATTEFLLTAPNSSIIENTGVLTFPAADSDWGVVSDWGLWSSDTGAVPDVTLYYYGPFETNKSITSGDTLQIASGQFTIEER